MSTTIDQRVVEMRFDNKQFERGVSTTMSTLDKLKQKLNLTGASKGLDNLNTAAKNVNMTGLGNAVETVTARFSALQVMGVTALANITNSAVNAGKNIVRSLTIEPIRSGFSEYETKMGSIQTILANTEHQGTTLDQVTAALDELNLYADKTIYNFQEMTRNIGTFTAAGVDLDTSVRSIQGIANLAAVSGSTSQQASTAMYQLSQALATGTVKLMDWNSVVNAGMGGKVFQNALIQTAAMLDGAASDVEAWQKKNIDAYGSFRDSLTQGEWLTSEVLTKTLEQFTMAAEEGSKEWEEFKKSLMDDGYTEAQAESILKMANTATDAATKVKTFTQLMDTLKESAQSGWAQTWEILIGDFEEAKEFFTGLSDLFGGIIGDSAERRNNLLSGTMSSNWEKLIANLDKAGIEASEFEDAIEKIVGKDKFDKLIEDFGSIEKAARAGKISSEDLKKAVLSFGKETKKALDFTDIAEKVKGNKFLYGLGSASDDVKKIQEALNSLGYDISVDGKFGKATYDAIRAFQKASGIKIDGIVGEETIRELEKATGKTGELTGEVDDLSTSCDDLIDGITKKSGRELLLDSLMNVIKAIHRPLAAVGEAMRNTFSVSPDQLYNALEAINKFTSKFVMKGPLDETTWDGLISKVNEFGISRHAFEIRLRDTLKEHDVDVKQLTKDYGSLSGAFESGAISLDIIKETLRSFDGISESMLLGGENADKLRRAFEGLFAIIEIVGVLAGNGLKIAFEVLSSVLVAFDMNILDLVANIGDGIVAFRDWLFEGNLIAKTIDGLIAKLPGVVKQFREWFNAFKETPAVQKLVTAIEAIKSAFDKLISGDINISEFAASLGTNLAKALKSLPGIAMQIASDFIAGFVGGIGSGVSGIINSVVSFCMDFVAAFAEALGVQSPSWKAYDIAVDFFNGFINGCKAIFSTVKKVLGTVGEQIVKIFKGIWDSITDESGNIEWGKIVAGGIIVSVLWILKQFADAFSGIAGAFENLGDIFENIGKSIKSFSKVLNAYAWDLKAKALQKLAIAIAILAASVFILAQIKDTGKLWNAVGVIGVLALIVVGLAFAMGQLSKASATYENGKLDIKGIQSGLMQIGIVIALLALAVKMIGSMDPETAKQGFLRLAAMVGGLIVFMGLLGVVSRFSGDIKGFGKTMLLMSVALVLMVTVIKKISKLEPDDIVVGLAVMEAFVLMMVQMGIAGRLAGKNGKHAKNVIGMSIAMAIMVGVIKLISSVELDDIIIGLAVIEAFIIMMVQMGIANRIAGKNNKVGSTMLGMAISMVLIVGVIKLISGIDVDDLFVGIVVMQLFVVLIAEMLLVSKLGKNAGKVAGTILSMSIAIGILAGLAILLSLIDTADLFKGIIAVTVLSTMMAIMVNSLKGAQNAKGAIMMMAICIGVMAASIVALSFIKPEDLMPATLALGALMGMFALMVKAGTKAKISLGSAMIMLGVVVVLAGVLAVLSVLKVGSTIEIAASIGLLMLTLGLTMQMISKVGTNAMAAMPAMVSISIIASLLGWVLVELSKMEPGPTLEIAASLSILLLSLAGVTAILTLVGAGAPAALGGIAALAIVIAGVGLLIGTLGYLNTKFPEIQTFLDTGIPILEKIGAGLGKFIGGFIGGIGEGMMDSLNNMVDTFGTIVDKLVEISDKGTGINTEGFNGVEKLLDALGSIALTTVGTTFSDLFTSGGTSMERFQTDGVAFFNAMKAISEASTGITVNEDVMDTVISLAQDLADLQSSLEPIGGVISWFAGHDDLGTFGTSVGLFVGSMVTALESLVGITINTTALKMIITAAQDLANLQSSLEPIGGVITWFTGQDDLGTFGTNVGVFIESMKTALGSLEGFTANTEALSPVISAAQDLAGLQASLEPIGGVISWFTGRDDLDTFGTNVASFISSMKTALATLEGATLNEEALTSVITAAERLAGLQEKLEPMGGVISWFAGRDDLGAFGTNISVFATAMGTLKTEMGEDGITEGVITSVTNAGNAIIALQEALPSESWFDGKMDLDTFAGYVTDFATAMGTFAAETAEMDPTSIDTAISTAYRIKYLIEALSGLDASGLASFAGVGVGDGHLVNMGQAIGKYGEAVAELNVEAVNTSVNAAVKLRSLIASLVGLDTSGIENFKIDSIGSAMKDYADDVADLDPSVVSASISAANRLKNFIVGLVGIDTSGITNFNPKPIGSAMQSYANSVARIDSGAVSASISAASRLKSFISSLAGFDSSGVAAFKSAINQLSTVDLDGLVSAFAGKAEALGNSAKSIIDSMVNGLSGGGDRVSTTMENIVSKAVRSAKDKASDFKSAGKTLVTNLANGIKLNSDPVKNAGKSAAGKAVSGAKTEYSDMYDAGEYLGDGLVGGIDSKVDDAYQAGYKLGQAAVQGEKDGQDSASPSKATIKAGKWLGEGLVIGIERMGSSVYKAGSSMGEDAIGSISKSISRISDVVNSDIDTQPTIRPVLDLSDIRAGVGAIDGMLNSNPIGLMTNIGAVNTMMNRRSQNGANSEVVSAINKLRKDIGNMPRESYNINGVTYDDGSNIKGFAQAIVHQARLERRV